MRTAVQEAQGGLRTISGIVNADGSILRGSDFQVQRAGTGAWQIRFFRPFRALRNVTASIGQNYGGFIAVPIAGMDTCTINTWTPAGAGIDLAFSFTATGW